MRQLRPGPADRPEEDEPRRHRLDDVQAEPAPVEPEARPVLTLEPAVDDRLHGNAEEIGLFPRGHGPLLDEADLADEADLGGGAEHVRPDVLGRSPERDVVLPEGQGPRLVLGLDPRPQAREIPFPFADGDDQVLHAGRDGDLVDLHFGEDPEAFQPPPGLQDEVAGRRVPGREPELPEDGLLARHPVPGDHDLAHADEPSFGYRDEDGEGAGRDLAGVEGHGGPAHAFVEVERLDQLDVLADVGGIIAAPFDARHHRPDRLRSEQGGAGDLDPADRPAAPSETTKTAVAALPRLFRLRSTRQSGKPFF